MIIDLLFSVACRGVQVLLSLLTVRQLVVLFGTEDYGVWVTLTSVLMWMALFDFGIGYGVKNRLSEAYARGDHSSVATLLPSVCAIYLILSLVVFLLFAIGGYLLEPFASHFKAALVMFFCTSLGLFFSLGTIVLQAVGAFKRFYFASLVFPVSWFLFVLFSKENFLRIDNASWVFGGAMLAQSVIFFIMGNRFFSVASFDFSRLFSTEIRQVLRVGAGFFILQLTSLFLFMFGNFIVYQMATPADVAVYDTINKVYQLFVVGYSILVSIAWTSIAKAKALGDTRAKFLVYKWLLFCSALVLCAALLLASEIDFVIGLLTAGKIQVSPAVAIPFAVFVFVQSLAFAGATYLNVYERLLPQIVLSVLAVPVFIFLAYYLLSSGFGVQSVPVACALAIAPLTVYCLLHGYKLARANV